MPEREGAGASVRDAVVDQRARKEHNAALPMMEAIRTLNRYGLEVTSGIILGLDTDTSDSEGRLKAFIDLSGIPILTINLLQALPRTPLWDRLKRDGRLIADDTGLESNVQFLLPYDEVVAGWRRCIALITSLGFSVSFKELTSSVSARSGVN